MPKSELARRHRHGVRLMPSTTKRWGERWIYTGQVERKSDLLVVASPLARIFLALFLALAQAPLRPRYTRSRHLRPHNPPCQFHFFPSRIPSLHDSLAPSRRPPDSHERRPLILPTATLRTVVLASYHPPFPPLQHPLINMLPVGPTRRVFLSCNEHMHTWVRLSFPLRLLSYVRLSLFRQALLVFPPPPRFNAALSLPGRRPFLGGVDILNEHRDDAISNLE